MTKKEFWTQCMENTINKCDIQVEKCTFCGDMHNYNNMFYLGSTIIKKSDDFHKIPFYICKKCWLKGEDNEHSK